MTIAVKLKNQREELEVEDILLESPEEDSAHIYVPDPDYGLKYVHRDVHGVHDFDLLSRAMAKGWNVILRGDTGSGKTMLPMAYAATNNLNYYSVPCDVSIDPRALFGKMMPTDRVGKFKWSDGPVTEMVKSGGVLNFSELNFMSAKIAASIFPLLDHRRFIPLLEHEGEVVRAHRPNCWCDLPEFECRSRWLLIVADMNPKYRGTTDLNLALANRFSLKVDWGYSDEAEEALVKSGELLDLVRKIRKVVEIRTPISTNSMTEFVDIACSLGMEFATQNFVAMFADNERQSVQQLTDVASENIKRDIDAVIQGKMGDDLIKEVPEDEAWFDQKSADEFRWEKESE